MEEWKFEKIDLDLSTLTSDLDLWGSFSTLGDKLPQRSLAHSLCAIGRICSNV